MVEASYLVLVVQNLKHLVACLVGLTYLVDLQASQVAFQVASQEDLQVLYHSFEAYQEEVLLAFPEVDLDCS